MPKQDGIRGDPTRLTASRSGRVCGVFALIVALFPTNEVGSPTVIGWIHYTGAAGLCPALAVYALFLFPRSARFDGQARGRENVVHRASGILMLAGIVAAAAHAMFWECDKSECAFVMITEVISLEAFGVSWLLAGRTLKSVESEESVTEAASSA